MSGIRIVARSGLFVAVRCGAMRWSRKEYLKTRRSYRLRVSRTRFLTQDTRLHLKQQRDTHNQKVSLSLNSGASMGLYSWTPVYVYTLHNSASFLLRKTLVGGDAEREAPCLVDYRTAPHRTALHQPYR